MVLALKLHRYHVRSGVGHHFVTPNDPGAPGACRRGRTASGWGRGRGGGNGQLGPCWSGGRWGPAGRDGQGQGAGEGPQACWEGSGPQKARAWASTHPRGPQDKRGHDPAGQGLSPAGLGGSVRTTATVSSRRPRSPALGPMVVAGPRLLPELSKTRPPPSPTAREGETWLWPVVRGLPGPASNAQFCPAASEKPQEVRKQGSQGKSRWLERLPAGDKPGSVGSCDASGRSPSVPHFAQQSRAHGCLPGCQ